MNFETGENVDDQQKEHDMTEWKNVNLVFSNPETRPRNISIRLSPEAVPDILEWYGSHHAGDRYTVTIDGRNVPIDANGNPTSPLP